MATVSQIAAPQRTARPQPGPRGDLTALALPGAQKAATVSQIAAPQGRRVPTGRQGEEKDEEEEEEEGEEEEEKEGRDHNCSIHNKYLNHRRVGKKVHNEEPNI